MFYLGSGTHAFSAFMFLVREYFNSNEFPDELNEYIYIYKVYKEYNAPIPEKLFKLLERKLVEGE